MRANIGAADGTSLGTVVAGVLIALIIFAILG